LVVYIIEFVMLKLAVRMFTTRYERAVALCSPFDNMPTVLR